MEYGFSQYKPSKILRGHLNLGGSSPSGGSIRVNSLYLERDGKPWIGVMGEYHYSRDSRENWAAELEKIRDGGVNIISTYVFWNYHEEVEGEYDFTGDRDLRAFITDCAALGLDVIIRIGPWCHGETRYGGLPDWLMSKPVELRTNDPEYLAIAEKWYRRIFEEVRGLFYKDGGPIVGVQIENEFTHDADHLLALKRLAQKIGYDVPLWTATGWNATYGARIPVDEFLPVFSGYADAPWAETAEELPPSKHFTFLPIRNETSWWLSDPMATDTDGWRMPYERYPFATCELGPGLQPTYHRRPTVSPMDAYTLALVKLGCGNNLMGSYMYHGGTNKLGRLTTLQESRATGYPNDLPILNYDFQAPISQYGEKRPQYGLLNLLHLFVQDFGDILAPMEHVGSPEYVPPEDREHLRYAMRTDGKGGFVFVSRYQRHMELSDLGDVELRPLGVEFPPITVPGGSAFIFPFNLPLGGETLKWATAQLICRDGDTLCFAAIPGVDPVYLVDGRPPISAPSDEVTEIDLGGVSIRTLPWERALRLRRTDGHIWYEDVVLPSDTPLTLTPCPQPFDPPYIEELRLSGDAPLIWHKLSVPSPDGFVTVPVDFDVAQIYVDGSLVADKFSDSLPWRLPASLIYNKPSHLVHTPPSPTVYHDPPKSRAPIAD